MATKIETFQKTVTDFYKNNKRTLRWREHINPYWVFLSEVMLQQTQVARVQIKFDEFVNRFSTLEVLADASFPEVLAVWKGLGYNRRAKYLLEAAQMLYKNHSGVTPQSIADVDALPGIGPATAAAIITYTYNKPTVFIETNIRRVFIHHFFADETDVADEAILSLVEKTLDYKNPRDWYYALMDYGSYLAKNIPNPNRKAKGYSVQSKFSGSVRQTRGALLRYFLDNKHATIEALTTLASNNPEFINDRLEAALTGLMKDGIVQLQGKTYTLAQ